MVVHIRFSDHPEAGLHPHWRMVGGTASWGCGKELPQHLRWKHIFCDKMAFSFRIGKLLSSHSQGFSNVLNRCMIRVHL